MHTVSIDVCFLVQFERMTAFPLQDEELQPTAASSVSGEFGSFSTTTFSDTFSGKCCQCPSCNQCRQITAEYEKETTVLQLVWTSLRAMIRKLYCMEKAELSVEEADSFRQQIDKYIVSLFTLTVVSSAVTMFYVCFPDVVSPVGHIAVYSWRS